MGRTLFVIAATSLVALATGCKTDNSGGAVKSVGDGVAGIARGAVSLVNVDLSNVLNKVALDLKIDKANVPINAQIPITLAAPICGVSINILAASKGGNPNCTANSTSPALEQLVQQQLAANGSVGGGNQSGTPGSGGPAAAATSTPNPTSSATPAPAPGPKPSPVPTPTASSAPTPPGAD